jgi:hypothetical protein
MVKGKKRVDWNRVERQFRAGLLSISEIARENGLPEANIRYHAKRLGWKRDLTDEMRSRTRTKMVENLAKVFDTGEAVDKLKQVQDEEIIEQASRTQVHVVREHQKTLGHGHGLTMRMLDELDATTTRRGELESMIKSDVAPIRQRALMNAVSLGARATIMRDLATAARLWVTLERQAFSIADDRDKAADNSQRKIDEMTAEQLRAEIVSDAKKMGLDLNPQDFDQGIAELSKTTNGSGKPH